VSDATPDSADTPEMKAYRRGKAAGYSVGIVDGWDACMRHVKVAFDAAITTALKEPEAVARHREAAGLKQNRKETDR
jgi:hypothetical protein